MPYIFPGIPAHLQNSLQITTIPAKNKGAGRKNPPAPVRTAVRISFHSKGDSKRGIPRPAKIRKPQCTAVHEDFRIKHNTGRPVLSRTQRLFLVNEHIHYVNTSSSFKHLILHIPGHDFLFELDIVPVTRPNLTHRHPCLTVVRNRQPYL